MYPPPPGKPGKQYRNHPLSFKQECVALVEAGETQTAVCQRFELRPTMLKSWPERFGSDTYQQTKKYIYSAAVKRQIAGDIVDGRLSYAEALLKYRVRHLRSLRAWVAAYRPAPAALPEPGVGTLPTAPLPESAAEPATELQHARWQLEALYTLIDHAETTYGIEIRKKAGAKQSK